MQFKEVHESDLSLISARKCAYYLKMKYEVYYRCLSTKVKYDLEKTTPLEDAELENIPLNLVREKAQQAMVNSYSSALDNNMKLLTTKNIQVTASEFVINTEDDSEYTKRRTNALNDFASIFLEESARSDFAPEAKKFTDIPEPMPLSDKALKVPNVVGFICAAKSQVAEMTEKDVTPVCVNPAAVIIAANITDLCVYDKNVWKAKLYTNNFFNRTKEYTMAANDLAHMLNKYLVPYKDCLKGVELTGLLARQITIMLANKALAPMLYEIRDSADKLKKKFPVHFKHTIGEYETGSIDHALKVNQSCQGIRGGDSKDNSAADFAFYVGVSLPRRLAKAFVFCHDLQRLFDRVRIPLELNGKDTIKRLQFLYEANTFFGIIKLSYAPKGFVPMSEGSKMFRKPGINFIVTLASKCLQLFFVDMDESIKNVSSPWAVQYRSLAPTDLEFLPCTSVHVLAGFVNVGRVPIRLMKMSDEVVSTLVTFSREVNRARTFFSHFVPFSELAHKYGMDVLVPRFQQIVLSMATASDRYDDLGSHRDYVNDVISGVLSPEQYADFVEQVEANRQQEVEGQDEENRHEREHDEQYSSDDENSRSRSRHSRSRKPKGKEKDDKPKFNLDDDYV